MENTSDESKMGVNEKPVSRDKRVTRDWIIKWLRPKSKSKRFTILLLLIFLCLLITLAVGYFCILIWLPELWKWGTDPLSWRVILSVFGAIYLIIGPFLPYYYFAPVISDIIKLNSEEAEKEFDDKISEIKKKQAEYENILHQEDTEGLFQMVTYSRLELEQYYQIGLRQTQKSYGYSMTAMWIGFFIIAFGIISYIVPTTIINPNLTGDGEIQALTIASGIFIELISGLFLWIYKKSINQLRYFYNRQIFIHNALLAYKISGTMKESDKAKTLIVEKILEFGISSNNYGIISNKQTKG
ncbi:MAG: hypothetical protein IH595_11710 [Bacteroidales bacterium]|nr:hypothetical protein [Bacteroidales bacterium]